MKKNKESAIKDEIEFLEKRCVELESSKDKRSELISIKMRLARLYNQIDNLSLYH